MSLRSRKRKMDDWKKVEMQGEEKASSLIERVRERCDRNRGWFVTWLIE